jgi:hypothetical protein
MKPRLVILNCGEDGEIAAEIVRVKADEKKDQHDDG